MNQEPPPLAPIACPKCGAANYAHLQACWLCHTPLRPANENPYAAGSVVAPAKLAYDVGAPVAAQSRVETMFMWLLVATVALAVMVGIGIGVQDSGLLTVYLVVLVPSLSAAGVRALYSLAKGESPKPSKMFMTFILSAMITFGLGALLILCTIIFLFLTCAQMLSGLGR